MVTNRFARFIEVRLNAATLAIGAGGGYMIYQVGRGLYYKAKSDE